MHRLLWSIFFIAYNYCNDKRKIYRLFTHALIHTNTILSCSRFALFLLIILMCNYRNTTRGWSYATMRSMVQVYMHILHAGDGKFKRCSTKLGSTYHSEMADCASSYKTMRCAIRSTSTTPLRWFQPRANALLISSSFPKHNNFTLASLFP